MGTYFNPPTVAELAKVGRALAVRRVALSGEPERGDPGSVALYRGLHEQLEGDELLIALYIRMDAPFDNAPHIHSARELEGFESQARTGRLLPKGFYAIPRTELPKAAVQESP